MLPLNELYNMDCMDGMKQFPDDYFDLAIVDPPYGGGATPDADSGVFKGALSGRFGGAFDKYFQKIKATRTGGGWSNEYGTGKEITHWDVSPPPEYFKELFRVSKNQIIWGGNYFALPPTRCFVVWNKLSISEGFSMSMAEYAWTSFNDNAKAVSLPPQGCKSSPRIHPTQKPIRLYQFCLKHFAKRGDKILDTHAGSASSLIACHGAGYDYMGFEVDKEYYRMAQERLAIARQQLSFL